MRCGLTVIKLNSALTVIPSMVFLFYWLLTTNAGVATMQNELVPESLDNHAKAV
jgi:hypothetical protein